MFSAQSLLAGNGASVTCLRESREPITTLNVATYVTPLVVRNFWLCESGMSSLFHLMTSLSTWGVNIDNLRQHLLGQANLLF